MDIAKFAIEHRVTTLVLTVVMILGGINAYNNLSRLEDPEFTIKEALVITPYTGASAMEVEEEVTDEIEMAVQKLGQLDEVESKSDRGLSTVTVRIKKNYDKSALPQVWDELRRKVGDSQKYLPPGAGPSIVIDDYGDVFGVFFAVYGPEYSYAELKSFVDILKRELLLVDDVAKVDTYGERTEVIYLTPKRDQMSQLGISVSTIVNELKEKNIATYSGKVHVGNEFITIDPTGSSSSIKDIESTLVSSGSDTQIYLRDIAEITRGYRDPQNKILRYDGSVAIGLGISTVSGGNVVDMGNALAKRLKELAPQTPLGIEFGVISLQSEAVTVAIDSFLGSLVQAVIIVIIVLLFFMGLRSAILIGFILVVTICGTFIFMGPMEVALERISLGALIIALGMLVDNAIVVVDGMLVRMEKGQDPAAAASEVVKQTAVPLLGATIIAVLAFAAIGTSDDSTGEFCRSLYQVVLTSLMLSWVTGVTVTPLLGTIFLKVKAPELDSNGNIIERDPYAGIIFTSYKALIVKCIKFRWVTLSVIGSIFAASIFGFGQVDQSFFPQSTRPQFMVDVWLPQGTSIETTNKYASEIESFILEQEEAKHVSSLIGQGALRFMLTYTPEKLNSGYMQFLVDVDDYRVIDQLGDSIVKHINTELPGSLSYSSKFQLGPASSGKIRARISGDDPNVLRSIANDIMGIMHDDPNTKSIKTDWRQRVKVVRPVIAEEQANLNGITRVDISKVLLQSFEGVDIGIYREKDLLLPIVLRAEEEERTRIDSMQNLQIWSPAANKYIPIRQVVSEFKTEFEDEIIMRLDRKRTITIFADPITGSAAAVFSRLRPQIEAMNLPSGYTLEWGGEYEDSGEAQAALAGSIPVFVLIMILIVVALFNNLRQPLIIWLVVPLSIIGVTSGLLLTGQPFGFMALLGFLSLIGMLLKNAIVLVDEVNVQLDEGKGTMPAILMSGVSRLRPVSMAALTTALGLLPLLLDAFFVSMAVTIIFGLVVATVLTMVIIPVLYATIYRVPNE